MLEFGFASYNSTTSHFSHFERRTNHLELALGSYCQSINFYNSHRDSYFGNCVEVEAAEPGRSRNFLGAVGTHKEGFRKKVVVLTEVEPILSLAAGVGLRGTSQVRPERGSRGSLAEGKSEVVNRHSQYGRLDHGHYNDHFVKALPHRIGQTYWHDLWSLRCRPG